MSNKKKASARIAFKIIHNQNEKQRGIWNEKNYKNCDFNGSDNNDVFSGGVSWKPNIF